MIGQRIKYLRESLYDKKMTQTAFGEKIGASRDVIANIEYGRVEPSQLIIKSICREFNVNETWLRTGEGEMFEDVTKDEQITKFVAKLLRDSDESFKRSVILALSEMPEEAWDTWADFIRKIAANYKDAPPGS